MDSSSLDALFIDACKRVHLSVLADLLASHPEHDISRIRADGGKTLLHLVAEANSVEEERTAQVRESQLEVFGPMVALLICGGLHINVADHRGRSCLHLGAKRGTGSFLKMLLNRGANAVHASKGTANVLHFAASNPNSEAWTTLLSSVPFPHTLLSAKNKHGLTPMQRCCVLGNAIGVVECSRYFEKPLLLGFTLKDNPFDFPFYRTSATLQSTIVKEKTDVSSGKMSSTSPSSPARASSSSNAASASTSSSSSGSSAAPTAASVGREERQRSNSPKPPRSQDSSSTSPGSSRRRDSSSTSPVPGRRAEVSSSNVTPPSSPSPTSRKERAPRSSKDGSTQQEEKKSPRKAFHRGHTSSSPSHSPRRRQLKLEVDRPSRQQHSDTLSSEPSSGRKGSPREEKEPTQRTSERSQSSQTPDIILTPALRKKATKELLTKIFQGRTRSQIKDILDAVSSESIRGGSWLHFCCKHSTEPSILALIHYGASSFADRAGMLPLHYTLSRGFAAASVALANSMPPALWRAVDANHRSFLHYLAVFATPPPHLLNSHLDLFNPMCSPGVTSASSHWLNLWHILSSTPAPTPSSIPSTPSGSVSSSNSILSMLSSDPLLSACDSKGNRPIHLLTSRDVTGHATDAMCRSLNWNDIWVVDKNGCNALHLASKNRGHKTLSVLLDFLLQGPGSIQSSRSVPTEVSSISSVLDHRDNQGRTPLHYAVKAADPICIQLLLEKGARSDIQDRKRLTVISLAAKYKSLMTLIQLVDNDVCTLEQAKFELSVMGFRSSIPELDSVKANLRRSMLQHDQHASHQQFPPHHQQNHSLQTISLPRGRSNHLDFSGPGSPRSISTSSRPTHPFHPSSSPRGDTDDRHALMRAHTAPLSTHFDVKDGEKFPLPGRRTGSAPADFFVPGRISPTPVNDIDATSISCGGTPNPPSSPAPSWSPPAKAQVSPPQTVVTVHTPKAPSPSPYPLKRSSANDITTSATPSSPSPSTTSHRHNSLPPRSSSYHISRSPMNLSTSDDSISLNKDSSMESLTSRSGSSSTDTPSDEEELAPITPLNFGSFSTRSYTLSPPRSPVTTHGSYTTTSSATMPGGSSPTAPLSPHLSPRSVSPRGGTGRSTPPTTPTSLDRLKLQRSLSPRSLPTIKEISPDNKDGKTEPGQRQSKQRNRSGSNSSLAKKALMMRSHSLSKLPTSPGEDFLEALKPDDMKYGPTSVRTSAATLGHGVLDQYTSSLLHHSRSHSEYPSNVDPVVSATSSISKKRPKSTGKAGPSAES